MRKFTLLLLLSLFLSACSQDKASTMSYDEVKKIMVDSLQTEDGKKALRQILEEPGFRELLVLEHDEVKKATEETLLSKEAEEFWKKTFEDPKFKETVAKSMQKAAAGYYEGFNERSHIPKGFGIVLWASRYAKAVRNHIKICKST